MPIELNRRDLMRVGLAGAAGSVAGVAGCAVASFTVGADRSARPGVDRVLVMSDTHIAGDAATLSRAGLNMSDRLAQVVDDVMPVVGEGGRLLQRKGPVRSLDFDAALINGDAAYDIGAEADYRTLVATMGPLVDAGLSVQVLLGNHDDRVNFRSVLGGAASALADKHVKKLGVEDGSRFCDWYLLDSLRVVDETPGALGAEQLAWLDEALGGSSGWPGVVVVHHPPVADEDPERPFSLQDHEAFWEVVSKHENVKAVLHGHTHRWEARKWKVAGRDVDLIGLPPTSYVFDEVNPWGYVVADVSAGGVSFTLRAMDGHAADGESVVVEF